MPKKPVTDEQRAAIRASATALCWKRAKDLPPQLRVVRGKFTSAVELSYSAVFPPQDTPLRGVVLFLHGINEHSERYFHVFQALAEMGFGAIAYDLRSHGKSHMDVPEMIAHVDAFQELIDDTNAFIKFAQEDIYPKLGVAKKLPLIIMGMSLGTLISVHTVLSEKHSLGGIVLVAPAMSVEWTPLLFVLSYFGTVMSYLCPTARLVPGVNEEWVARDPLVNADYDDDPLTTRDMMTCRMGDETSRFMSSLHSNKSVEDASSAFCNLPILFLMGSNDKVTSLPLAQDFYNRIANKDKHFEIVEEAYHVLFEDFKRQRVLDFIKEWLYKRFPEKK